jgi:hypothetical protein
MRQAIAKFRGSKSDLDGFLGEAGRRIEVTCDCAADSVALEHDRAEDEEGEVRLTS